MRHQETISLSFAHAKAEYLEPSVNAIQGTEPSISAIQITEAHPLPPASDPSGVDREKYGLFRLTAPTTGSHSKDASLDTDSIDIVAVHGLNGAANRTWTYGNGNF